MIIFFLLLLQRELFYRFSIRKLLRALTLSLALFLSFSHTLSLSLAISLSLPFKLHPRKIFLFVSSNSPIVPPSWLSLESSQRDKQHRGCCCCHRRRRGCCSFRRLCCCCCCFLWHRRRFHSQLFRFKIILIPK